MRNLAFFLAAFLITCLIGLTTGCSSLNRVPTQAELQRWEQKQAQRKQQQAQREKSDWQQLEAWAAAKQRESATWWNCTRDTKGTC